MQARRTAPSVPTSGTPRIRRFRGNAEAPSGHNERERRLQDREIGVRKSHVPYRGLVGFVQLGRYLPRTWEPSKIRIALSDPGSLLCASIIWGGFRLSIRAGSHT